MTNWVASMWDSIRGKRKEKRKPFTYRTEYSPEMPSALRKERLYAIGDRRAPWSAAMLCPCGCGAVIELTLLKSDSPSWRLSVDRKGRPTLAPSVRRLRGCRSHFLLREGRIAWCTDRSGE